MSDLVAIGTRELTARINPMGAELWSLTDGEGREYMTDADPAFWTGHAPVLFPIVGELKDGTYRLDGRDHALARHGFARRSMFDLIEHRGNVARFRLTDGAETRAVYPFAFVLELAFRITGRRLEMEASVRNPGDVPLPFSFGYHPAFAWPLPGGGEKLAHVLEFAEAEPHPIKRLGDNGLVAREEATPIEGRTLRLAPALFEDDAMILDALESRSLVYRGAGDAPRLEIAFPDTPYLGIWQKPGAHYICVEPWQGLADADGFDGDFCDKRGVVLLAPGAVHSLRMDVTLVLPD
ncbi:aldose epimerase [Novosphingobium sp. PC22D]|uniref:aldose 1-epimerase family protein n=1 Tax=Novosphingobium sp. PC22D TaxID=1962403 RepID=UPI000BF0E503|nr:aldose 1-epimerase family protein [Novosphingobium sp. PC22D]PEQ12366.1 aldose epimerase [Novosphingobium sp. PC22D]